MVAEDSRYEMSTCVLFCSNKKTACLAHLALPDKVRLSSASAHLVHLLLLISSVLKFLISRFLTYKSGYIDPVWVHLSARSTLDFESVVEWVLWGIIRTEVRDAGRY